MPASRESALETVTAGLSAAATREDILRSILSAGNRVLPSSAGVAYLKSRAGDSLDLVAHEGVPGALAAKNATIPLTSAYPVAQAMREARPIWVSSRKDLDREFPDFARVVDGAFEHQSIVALPLRVAGIV